MWHNYIQQTKDKPVSKHLVEAVQLLSHTSPSPQSAPFTSRHSGEGRNLALDLGSGAGADTRYLVSQGFQVTAVDAEPTAQDCLTDLIDQNQVKFNLTTFDNFNFKTYQLINASYALPFISTSNIPSFWQKLERSLSPNGIFTGQFFGTKDSWNTGDGAMNFHTRAGIEELFKDWNIIKLDEEDHTGPTALGPTKHWHIFHVIAQKP